MANQEQFGVQCLLKDFETWTTGSDIESGALRSVETYTRGFHRDPTSGEESIFVICTLKGKKVAAGKTLKGDLIYIY